MKIYGKLGLYDFNANDNKGYIRLFIEVLNTTRETVIIRDFSGLLIEEDKIIDILKSGTHSTKGKNNEVIDNYYGNKSSYSFTVLPKTIKNMN